MAQEPLTEHELENGVFNIQHILKHLVQGKWMKFPTRPPFNIEQLIGMGEDGSIGYLWLGVTLKEDGTSEQMIRIPSELSLSQLIRLVYPYSLFEIEEMIKEGQKKQDAYEFERLNDAEVH